MKKCESLWQLYLTGNPCTDFNDHRTLAIAIVPQLISIDGIDIKPSERILSK